MNRRPSILDQTAHTKTILNDRARFSVKDIGFLVQQFEGVYSEGNMVQTTTDTVERSSQKPRKAGVKEQQETNNITDAVLKYEGKSFNWNGIVMYRPRKTQANGEIYLLRTRFEIYVVFG